MTVFLICTIVFYSLEKKKIAKFKKVFFLIISIFSLRMLHVA